MSVLESLFQAGPFGDAYTVEQLLLSLLVALITGQLTGWFYRWTHRGVSYSRTFTHALIIIAMVAALSMSLVARNVVAAFGLLGGLAIIRFRTVLRDARDTAYVLLALVCGMAAGFGYYSAAVLGALAINVVAFYLERTGFGAWQTVDSLLRFRIASETLGGAGLEVLLRRYCRKYAVMSVDELPASGSDGAAACQCTYKVRLRDPERAPDLVAALKQDCQTEAVQLLVDMGHEEVV